MKIAFFSCVLNHHQACLADELYSSLGNDYTFVETTACSEQKGASEDYSDRRYLVRAWESEDSYEIAMRIAITADVCVFDGIEALSFEKARMKCNLLSFDTSERYLKKGLINLASPIVLRLIMAYHLGGWRNKQIYKLCMSAYATNDQYLLFSYKNRCYKWGYFTRVDEDFEFETQVRGAKKTKITNIMWCARFLKWKHPELPIILAKRLKEGGYDFVLDMYGNGVEFEKTKLLAKKLDVADAVNFHGNVPNGEITDAMKKHELFIFTSDKNEGWGAVLNESMSNGCAVVGSHEIGSVPYLIEDGVNGLIFQSRNIDSLYEKVTMLIDNPEFCYSIRQEAVKTMKNLWSPKIAAKNLLILIDNLQNNQDTAILEGPCSRALPL